MLFDCVISLFFPGEAYIYIWVNSQNKWRRATRGWRRGRRLRISEHLADEAAVSPLLYTPQLSEQQRRANAARQGHTLRGVSLCCVGPTHGPFMCGRARARAAKHTIMPTESRRRKDAAREGEEKNSFFLPDVWRVVSYHGCQNKCFLLSAKAQEAMGPRQQTGKGWGEDRSQVEKREPKTLMLGAEGSPGPDERKVNSF